MTDHTQGHADDDRLSALLDGEATSWNAHVDGCPECTLRLDRLTLVRSVLAEPIAPPVTTVRDRTIAAALAVYDEVDAPTQPMAASVIEVLAPVVVAADRAPRTVARPALAAIASVAAVVLVLAAAAGVITGGGGGARDDQALSTPASRDTTDQEASAMAAAGVVPLGEVADVEALVAKVTGVGGPLAGTSSGQSAIVAGPAAATASASNSGETGDATASARSSASAESTANSGALSEASAFSGASGTAVAPTAGNPCETEVRRSRPAAGDLVYQAVASHRGLDTVVFGFQPRPPGTSSAAGPLTLVMVAGVDCRVLLEAVVP